MTIIRHELRQGRKSFLVWCAAIATMLIVCVFLFPEMKGQMSAVSDMFASMGSFTAAFGMDRLDFGTFIGYYAIECGNVLGLGGAFFAALAAISALAKEEKDKTAEFLLTHPVSRARVVSEKLASVLIQITALNVVVFALCLASVAAVGEPIPFRELSLLHLAYLLMQVELAALCFGLSAFIRRGSLGVGLGLTMMMYFLNIVSNLAESARPLKFITPFGYTEGADIVTNGALDLRLVLIGLCFTAAGIAAAYARYCKKDIRSA